MRTILWSLIFPQDREAGTPSVISALPLALALVAVVVQAARKAGRR